MAGKHKKLDALIEKLYAKLKVTVSPRERYELKRRLRKKINKYQRKEAGK